MTLNLTLPLAPHLALWAQANAWEQTITQLRANSVGLGGNLLYWSGVFIAAVAVWCLIQRWFRWRSERQIDDPRRLFRDLCRAHRLSWKETSLLRELAERRGLENPALLLVREDYFDGYGEALDEVKSLREKLFA